MLITTLKEQTAHLHEQVEEAMGSSRIMSPDYSPEEYVQLLKNLWRAHSAVEPALAKQVKFTSHPELKGNFRIHKKNLLEKELRALGAGLPEPLPEISLSSEAEAWGVFYVMKGSTLGGAVISRHLSKNTDWPVKSFDFYNYYGEETGKLWGAFKKIFTEENPDEKAGEVLAGARKAYQVFLDSALQTTSGSS